MPRILLISATILSVTLVSCKKETKEAPPSPTTVDFVNPKQEEITSWDYYNGRLEAVESVEVRARVSGLLEKVHFKPGANVEKGDLLFTLDKAPFLAAKRADEAQVAQTTASADLARSNYARAQELLKRNAIAKEEVDVRAGNLAETEAELQAALAELETAELNLSYTDVRSPISGRISDHFITIGNIISGGTADSTLLTTIVTIDPIYARIDANEASVLKYLRLEQEGKRASARNEPVPVEMALNGDEGFPLKGQIDFVNNSFDPNTATLRARAIFPNESGIMTPGMFTKVRLPGRGEYEATLIPEIAIQSLQSLTTVLVIDEENIVRSKPVKLGPAYGQMRVIESDLPTDSRVVVSHLTTLRAGTKVTPQLLEKDTDKSSE
ncbi:efflux RND transporter periplasmic adaptor subunit [Luteolibacter sp. AS25]|uniref:efflux RND transporter periplasmic adaptor subunit n=1 Tax=Luteolibacter sp. AS25 TaxID=3135776 RepID=UPI00398B35B2